MVIDRKIKIVKWVLVALVCGLGQGSIVKAQLVDSNYVFSHYNDRIALFDTLSMPTKAIVFIGNSITEAGKWHDIVPNSPVVNRGISGDISFGVVARLDQVLRHKPAKIFIMIGTNDLKREIPESFIVENHRRIIRKIKDTSPKTKIYVQTVLPVHDGLLLESFNKVTNEKVRSLNKALMALARQHKVTFVDLHIVLSDTDGQLKEELTGDGIHLKPQAYDVWVNELKRKKYL